MIIVCIEAILLLYMPTSSLLSLKKQLGFLTVIDSSSLCPTSERHSLPFVRMSEMARSGRFSLQMERTGRKTRFN